MSATDKPTHSSSTNPYIPKGDGAAPVDAYLAAMPGWKSKVGHQINEVIETAFPEVRKQVRWNTPFYGKEDGWLLSLYCYKKYVQIAFLTGSHLVPMPPKASKVENTRYLDIYEDDELDVVQLTEWVRQSLKQPGQLL